MQDENSYCYLCSEDRSSVLKCTECEQRFCSECSIIDRKTHLKNQIHEKERYIQQTSEESIDIVVNWFERLINNLIECQTQIIDQIQNERDQTLNQLNNIQQNIDRDINKYEEFKMKLSNYQITKQIDLPDFHYFKPRYQISYQSKTSSTIAEEEENWDLETSDYPLSSTQTTTSMLFSNHSSTFIIPKDDDDDEDEDFQWIEVDDDINQENSSEYFLNPRLYHPGTFRQFNSDIHLIASNGNDLLCYSRQTKQIIYIYDENLDPLILSWYHGHIIQLVWFDQIKSFVLITDHNQYEIYTIELTINFRLKIRLQTYLTKTTEDILKEQIFLRTDNNHIFIYYEKKLNGKKRLRLLNSSFECIRSYPIDKLRYLQNDDQEKIIAFGISDEHIVLFVQTLTDLCLFIFNKSQMSLIRRLILLQTSLESPLIIHFQTLSFYFLLDQSSHCLRFYQIDKEIGQIPIYSSTNSTHYNSLVLRNDGSLLLSNNTKTLLAFVLHDQTNEFDEW